VTLFSMMRQQK